MSNEIKLDRREFLRNSAATIATAKFASVGSVFSQEGVTSQKQTPPTATLANASFTSLKMIEAGVLNVAYAEAGPTAGRAVILLHGWPYDIHSYADVAPSLATAGYRVINHPLLGVLNPRC